MTIKTYIAFYKGHKDGYAPSALVARFSDWLTRKLTKGSYSHCEFAVQLENDKFSCRSSSIRDGGVRTKIMELPADKWDLVELHLTEEGAHEVVKYFTRNYGKKYDFFGALGVVFKTRQNKQRYFCSEICAEALGFPEAWRFSPNDLHAIVTQKPHTL
ncbi:hypothetical protein [Gallibacterium anatis]|uniref:Enoyl-CoA hydratase n=1 Tax=Gallibacterium anatis 4895 TaxID=1396510 RepID=A0A0A2ZY72_9PAST|nr:hypothetical protein [Gallibacterium anatis]KGQ59740.1 hypothetical protein IO48_11005 [Gallibacterium anatis 4895]